MWNIRIVDNSKRICRKEKNVNDAEKNTKNAVSKENQIEGLISSMVKSFDNLPKTLADNIKTELEAQTASKGVLEAERSELMQKLDKNEFTLRDFNDEKKRVDISIVALKDKVLELAEVLSGNVSFPTLLSWVL